MTILFLQTAHPKDDDRVFYHQWRSLEAAGHTCAYADGPVDIAADIVLCDTPRAVWYAHRAGSQARVVYDITEWYPSKKNLRDVAWWKKPWRACAMAILNIWAAARADALVFGEYYKARPFRWLMPWKKCFFLPYYPFLAYIPYRPAQAIGEKVKLFYAGPQTSEKGFERVQQVVKACEQLLPQHTIALQTMYKQPFETFCAALCEQDIFLDLRDADAENTRCLPIKLFYYLAAGRVVVFSNLQAIRQAVPAISDDSLFAPDDIAGIAQQIAAYVQDPELYVRSSQRNRALAEQTYHGEEVAQAFVQWLSGLID